MAGSQVGLPYRCRSRFLGVPPFRLRRAARLPIRRDGPVFHACQTGFASSGTSSDRVRPVGVPSMSWPPCVEISSRSNFVLARIAGLVGDRVNPSLICRRTRSSIWRAAAKGALSEVVLLTSRSSIRRRAAIVRSCHPRISISAARPRPRMRNLAAPAAGRRDWAGPARGPTAAGDISRCPGYLMLVNCPSPSISLLDELLRELRQPHCLTSDPTSPAPSAAQPQPHQQLIDLK